MRWNDPKLISSSSKFLRLKQGENKVRLVSEVGVMGKHWDNRKMVGVCIGKDEGCPHCAEGNDPKPVWLCWAIDRIDSKIKQLEMGYTIIQQLQKLAQSKEYGFTESPPYDITIIKTGEGLDTEYTVIASRQDTELTPEEIEKVQDLTPIKDIIEKRKKITEENEPF